MNARHAIYAVIDTNVLVSALFSKSGLSNPALIIEAIADGAIIPMFNEEILEEYREVLARDKFKFNPNLIEQLLTLFTNIGLNTERNRQSSEVESFPDPDDLVFYEVAMTKDDSYLITGNLKHFPAKPFVVNPTEMIEILINKGLL